MKILSREPKVHLLAFKGKILDGIDEKLFFAQINKTTKEVKF
jgi:hypothetical protein